MVKEIEDKYYNEEAQKPSLEIIDNLMRLVSGSDYEATYSNNRVVGKSFGRNSRKKATIKVK
ncbi:MAG: hypothetical protein L6U99_00975 [Clostridium sp.]|nr:MAG: hypothetical protein L6U99_00975 [Clostridium sp.]